MTIFLKTRLGGWVWIALMISAFRVSLANAQANTDSWQKIREDDGITIYQKEIPGSQLLAFKGEADVNSPVERIAAVIFDTRHAPEWVVDLEESKIVRWISQNEFIEYDHIKTPPIIMKDRDFVSRVTISVNPQSKQFTFHYQSVEDPALPETDRMIRGNLMNTTFILTPIEGNTKTHLSGEIHCDPKGGVAQWIVNWFQSNWPTNTLKNLRVQVAKSNASLDERMTHLFALKP